MNLQLTSLDVLYLSISIGFLVLVGFISYLAMKMAKAIEILQVVAEDIEDTTHDIRGLKNTVKGGMLGIASTVLGIFTRKKRG